MYLCFSLSRSSSSGKQCAQGDPPEAELGVDNGQRRRHIRMQRDRLSARADLVEEEQQEAERQQQEVPHRPRLEH